MEQTKRPTTIWWWDINLYWYVLSDPVDLVDPTGEYWAWITRGAWVAGKWIVKKIRVWVKPKPRKDEYGGPGQAKHLSRKQKIKLEIEIITDVSFVAKKLKKVVEVLVVLK